MGAKKEERFYDWRKELDTIARLLLSLSDEAFNISSSLDIDSIVVPEEKLQEFLQSLTTFLKKERLQEIFTTVSDFVQRMADNIIFISENLDKNPNELQAPFYSPRKKETVILTAREFFTDLYETYISNPEEILSSPFFGLDKSKAN
jgi:hypothetical protein